MKTWRVVIGTDCVTKRVEADTQEEASNKLLREWYKEDDKFGLSLNIIDVRPSGEDKY